MFDRIRHSISLRVRRALGKGFRRGFFERFYESQGPDAWRYDEHPHNQTRWQVIVDALPPDTIGRTLEIGCAEGHMTRLLAGRAQRVVAVDIVEEAVRRARDRCAKLPNVQFRVGDIRDGLPEGQFDSVIGSDVLYYLSLSELSATLRRLAEAVREHGALVASEFSPGAVTLPSRMDDVIRLGHPEWERVDDRFRTLQPNGDGIRVVVFRRRQSRPPTP